MTTSDDPMREFVRALFAPAPDDDDYTPTADTAGTADSAPAPDRGNHVPREGNNPRPVDDPMRTFVRDLFNPHH